MVKSGKEITSREHVKILADIFNPFIKNNWRQHLDNRYRFRETVLLGEKAYRSNPFSPYLDYQINKTHFGRWIKLGVEFVDENFYREKAEESKWQVEKMAEMFQIKMEYCLNHPYRIAI